MLPIDEMLGDLREVLEAFDSNPTPENFDKIQHETYRIEIECENLLPVDD